MKNILCLLGFLVIILSISRCERIESLPPVPYIEYRSFEVFDTLGILDPNKNGRLKFYFEDGDGDLADEVNETSEFFITFYQKSEGVMVPIYYNDTLLYTIAYSIPFIENEGQNKILKGTIEVTLDNLFTYFSTTTDTAKFDFYIMDRAMNESNVASTNEINIRENGVY